MNQADFGSAGGVNRNTQAEYEGGKRPCTVSYLGQLAEIGVDICYILTGHRAGDTLAPDVADYADLSPRLGEEQKRALLLIATAIAQPVGGPPRTAAPPITLPPEEALERGYLAVLAASRHMDEGELAHELATRLPTMLGIAQGRLTIEQDHAASAEAPPSADPASRRASHT